MTNLKMASRVSCTVVAVGDSRVGKTALVRRFATGEFAEHYSPTSFDKSFARHEVDKHQVEFSFWDTSGSPAYDSVRSLSYQEADVFLLCYKVSDPISLYNVKNKWTGEIRRHRPDAPVVLCGCQHDLREDPATLAHLSRTGRAPVSREQALAICCEIGAVNYVETTAKMSNAGTSGEAVAEAFELCALAAIKHKNSTNNINNNNNNVSRGFSRSPSIHSSMSLFDSGSVVSNMNNNNVMYRSPSALSNLSLSSSSVRMAPPTTLALKRSSLTSLKSPEPPPDPQQQQANRIMRTFSPEPNPLRIPPVISENETLQAQSPFGELPVPPPAFYSPPKRTGRARPRSLCDPQFEQRRPPRPTTLFKESPAASVSRGASMAFSPMSETGLPTFNVHHRRGFDSVSELGTPLGASCNTFIRSPQAEVSWPANAQVRPCGLARRTSYRTHPKMAIPVATPMSPVGSEISLEVCKADCAKSPHPTAAPTTTELSSISESTAARIPVFYESLKSSSSSSSSEEGSSVVSKPVSDDASIFKGIGSPESSLGMASGELVPDTEDPELISSLKFVSPKSGVYRPSSSSRAKAGKCAIM